MSEKRDMADSLRYLVDKGKGDSFHAFAIEEIDRLRAELEKRNAVVQYCYDACLCERFETYGFDYHEKHPKFGNKGGSRSKTPKVYIEDVIGFEWKYEKPDGACHSWKELKLNALTQSGKSTT